MGTDPNPHHPQKVLRLAELCDQQGPTEVLRSKGVALVPRAFEARAGKVKAVDMDVSINGGTPIAGWFIMQNPRQMDDVRVPLFGRKPP